MFSYLALQRSITLGSNFEFNIDFLSKAACLSNNSELSLSITVIKFKIAVRNHDFFY